EVEVIRQVRLQRRVAAVRGERTDARQSAYVQNRRQEVDRRTGQGARRSEAQMHILGDLELGVQARQQVRVVALGRDRLRIREGRRQQRRIGFALLEADRQTTHTGGSHIR